MPKNSRPKEEWTEIVVTFRCPEGHEVPIQFTHLRTPGSMRELRDRVYSPLCSQCGWTKNMSGHESVSIQPVQ
jgi:rubredoxin